MIHDGYIAQINLQDEEVNTFLLLSRMALWPLTGATVVREGQSDVPICIEKSVEVIDSARSFILST